MAEVGQAPNTADDINAAFGAIEAQAKQPNASKEAVQAKLRALAAKLPPGSELATVFLNLLDAADWVKKVGGRKEIERILGKGERQIQAGLKVPVSKSIREFALSFPGLPVRVLESRADVPLAAAEANVALQKERKGNQLFEGYDRVRLTKNSGYTFNAGHLQQLPKAYATRSQGTGTVRDIGSDSAWGTASAQNDVVSVDWLDYPRGPSGNAQKATFLAIADGASYSGSNAAEAGTTGVDISRHSIQAALRNMPEDLLAAGNESERHKYIEEAMGSAAAQANLGIIREVLLDVAEDNDHFDKNDITKLKRAFRKLPNETDKKKLDLALDRLNGIDLESLADIGAHKQEIALVAAGLGLQQVSAHATLSFSLIVGSDLYIFNNGSSTTVLLHGGKLYQLNPPDYDAVAYFKTREPVPDRMSHKHKSNLLGSLSSASGAVVAYPGLLQSGDLIAAFTDDLIPYRADPMESEAALTKSLSVATKQGQASATEIASAIVADSLSGVVQTSTIRTALENIEEAGKINFDLLPATVVPLFPVSEEQQSKLNDWLTTVAGEAKTLRPPPGIDQIAAFIADKTQDYLGNRSIALMRVK